MAPDAPPWDLDAGAIERRPNPWPQMSTVRCPNDTLIHTYGDADLNASLTRAVLAEYWAADGVF